MDAPDPRDRALRFHFPRPREGEQVMFDGETLEWALGAWRHPQDAQRARRAAWRRRSERMEVRHEHSRWIRRAEMLRKARPSVSDMHGAFPDEFAVRTVDAHGRERIDYKRIPIKNADGTLNKHGKRLVEMHERQFRLGADDTFDRDATVPRGTDAPA